MKTVLYVCVREEREIRDKSIDLIESFKCDISQIFGKFLTEIYE